MHDLACTAGILLGKVTSTQHVLQQFILLLFQMHVDREWDKEQKKRCLPKEAVKMRNTP